MRFLKKRRKQNNKRVYRGIEQGGGNYSKMGNDDGRIEWDLREGGDDHEVLCCCCWCGERSTCGRRADLMGTARGAGQLVVRWGEAGDGGDGLMSILKMTCCCCGGWW